MVFTLQLIYIATVTYFALLIINGVICAIGKSCQLVKQKRDEIDAIPFMKKRELIQLARKHKVNYSRLNKYELQNTLIYKLA